MDPDEYSRHLAAESLAVGDPTGWFGRLYVAAEGGEALVPWDRGAPHRMLVEWAERRRLAGSGERALVVGCGYGADAEYISGLGFDTVAFDVAVTAVEATRRRFPDSDVRYVTADLLDPPAHWRGAFDLVVESLTVQSLPRPLHAQAMTRVKDMVDHGGTLIVIAAATDESSLDEGPPWPLTRAEIETFAADDLLPVRIEDVHDADDPNAHRWRAEFRSTHAYSD